MKQAMQLVKYAIAGTLAVVVHFVTLAFLVEVAGLVPLVSTTVGFLLGCAVNYMLQHLWVFAATGNHATFLSRYIVVTAITTTMNVALFHLLFSIVSLWYLFAQAISTIVIFLVNFEINRRFTFRGPPA